MSKLKTQERYYFDFEFYKKNQLINPLERLMQPVDSGLYNCLNEIFGFSKHDEQPSDDKAQ